MLVQVFFSSACIILLIVPGLLHYASGLSSLFKFIFYSFGVFLSLLTTGVIVNFLVVVLNLGIVDFNGVFSLTGEFFSLIYWLFICFYNFSVIVGFERLEFFKVLISNSSFANFWPKLDVSKNLSFSQKRMGLVTVWLKNFFIFLLVS